MGPRSGNAFLRAFTVGTDDLFSTDGFDGVAENYSSFVPSLLGAKISSTTMA